MTMPIVSYATKLDHAREAFPCDDLSVAFSKATPLPMRGKNEPLRILASSEYRLASLEDLGKQGVHRMA